MKTIANLDINFRQVDHLKKGLVTTTLEVIEKKIYVKYMIYDSDSKKFLKKASSGRLYFIEIDLNILNLSRANSFDEIESGIITFIKNVEGIE